MCSLSLGKGDCPAHSFSPAEPAGSPRSLRTHLESLWQKPRAFHRSGENTAPSKLPLQSSPPGDALARCSLQFYSNSILLPSPCPRPRLSGQLPGLDRALREELDYPSSLTPGQFSPGQQLQLMPSRSCTPSAWSSTGGLCLPVGLACAGDRCRVASSLRVWMPPSRPLLPTVLLGCVQQQVAGVGAVGSPACAAPLPASLGHVSLPLEEREQRQLPVFQSCPPAPPPSLWPTPAHTQQASKIGRAHV